MYWIRVLRGLAFINKKRPDHWIRWVNLETLDLQSGDFCALAQACGRSYSIAARDLALPFSCEVKYGFALRRREGESAEALARRYRRLTRTWRIALRIRRKRYEAMRKIHSAWIRWRFA